MLFETLLKWLGLLWGSLEPAMPALITSFFSVLIGAMPFIVIASFASATLEVFVSKDTIARLLPRSGLLGVLAAPLLGVVVPMCECGIIPVARRMIQKGVPGSAAITFMLANPILNPLSVYSTYLAFSAIAPEMVWWRVGLGYLVSVAIGLLIHLGIRTAAQQEVILHESLTVPAAATMAGGSGVGCACGHDHGEHVHGGPLGQRVQAWLDHAATEFFDVFKYFIIGAFLAATAQAVISREMLEAVGGGPVMSVLVMMGFGFLLSICSEADAFVAAAFASTFTPGALLAFLVAGPMTDVKNTMMMLASFRRPFVIFLNAAIFGLTALVMVGLNLWLGWGG